MKLKLLNRLPLIGLSWILFLGGFASLFSYGDHRSMMARRTYVSENALLVNAGKPGFTVEKAQVAAQLSAKLRLIQQSAAESFIENYQKSGSPATAGSTADAAGALETLIAKRSAEFISEQLLASSLEVFPLDQRQTSTDLLRKRGSEEHERLNFHHSAHRRLFHHVYAVLRAPKADGSAALVVSAHLPNFLNNTNLSELLSGSSASSSSSSKNLLISTAEEGSVDSVSLLLSLVDTLREAPWRAKDIVVVFVDGGAPAGLGTWLQTYQQSKSSSSSSSLSSPASAHLATAFPRAGALFAALNVEVWPPLKGFSRLCFLTVGVNGRLPNLDLVNALSRIFQARGGVQNARHELDECREDLLPTMFKEYFNSRQRVLFNHIAHQARGIPTGAHGDFSQSHVDAVTVRAASGGAVGPFPIATLAISLEMTLRSYNNLIEYLHQSFWYYLLQGSMEYIPIGDYMINFACILGPMALLLLRQFLLLSSSDEPADDGKGAKDEEKDGESSSGAQASSSPLSSSSDASSAGPSSLTPLDSSAPVDGGGSGSANAFILPALALISPIFLSGVLVFSLPFIPVVSSFVRSPRSLLAATILCYLAGLLVSRSLRSAMIKQQQQAIQSCVSSSVSSVARTIASSERAQQQTGRVAGVLSALPVVVFLACFSLVNFAFTLSCAIAVVPVYLLFEMSVNSATKIDWQQRPVTHSRVPLRSIVVLWISTLLALLSLFPGAELSPEQWYYSTLDHFLVYGALLYPFVSTCAMPWLCTLALHSSLL